MTLEELENTIFCEINDEERRIEVPPIYRVLGVESDEKVNRLRFKCPRIVGDNVDLSTLNLFVNYENANSEKNIYLITDVEVVGDYIVFSWLLSRHVTEYKGNVRYIICAKKSINGNTTNEWNTRPASGVVNEGLEAIHETEEQNSDVIEEILSRLSVLDGFSQLSTPDWNENDSNSSDFIKNRTHWSEEDYVYSDVIIRNPTRIENPNLSIDFVAWNDTSTNIELIAGDFYRLSINNDTFVVEGECKHYINQNNEFDEFDYIGNINLYDNSKESDGSVILIGCDTNVIGRMVIRTTNDIIGSSANISIGHKETIYHKLSQNYIEQPANKKTLDKLYSEGDYAPNTDNTGMPVINPNEYNYLKFGNKFLRYTKDGSVIKSVKNITKDGKDFLRLYLEWDPDTVQFTNRKPAFIDIPIEGTETVEVSDLSLGTMSTGIEMILAEPTSPDWSENDTTSPNYIENRTHYYDDSNVYSYELPDNKSGLDKVDIDLSSIVGTPSGTVIISLYKIGNAVLKDTFYSSIIEQKLPRFAENSFEMKLDGTPNSSLDGAYIETIDNLDSTYALLNADGHLIPACVNVANENATFTIDVGANEPFTFTINNTGLYVPSSDLSAFDIGFLETSRVYNNDGVYNKLPIEYLPEGIGWTEPGEEINLPEDKTSLPYKLIDGSAFFDAPENTVNLIYYRIADEIQNEKLKEFSFEFFGDEYLINDLIDDDAYSMVDNNMCILQDGVPVLFNIFDDVTFNIDGLAGSFNQPGLYVIYADLSAVYGEDTEVIKITSLYKKEIVHKIPDKFVNIPEGLSTVIEQSHTHNNRSILDSITQTDLNDISLNTQARHSHNNKAILDSITQDTLSKPESDWSENDASSINYIKNRTHWHENGYDYSLPSDTSNLPSIRAGFFTSAWVTKSPLMKRIGNAVSQNLFANSIIEMPLETWINTDIRLDGTEYGSSDHTIIATITVFTDSNTGNQIARTEGGPEGAHVKYLCANIIGPSTNIGWYDPSPTHGGSYDITFPQTGLYIVDDDDAKHVVGHDDNYNQILEDVFQITRIYCTRYTKKLDDDYLSENANDSITKRHSHDNKPLLDTIVTKNIPDVDSSGTAYDALMVGSKHITELNPIIFHNSINSINLRSGIPCILLNAIDSLSIVLTNKYEISSSDDNFVYSPTLHSNYPEYYIDFITSSNLSNVYIYELQYGNVPDIEWVDEPVFEPNKHYQISILGNIGLWVATNVEPDEEGSGET